MIKMPEISTRIVIKVLQKLIRELEESGVDNFVFEDDWYWDVPLEELTRIDLDFELEAGSLADDIGFLTHAAVEGVDFRYYEFERIAPLLRFVYKTLNARDLSEYETE
jgi:hypothetical protein